LAMLFSSTTVMKTWRSRGLRNRPTLSQRMSTYLNGYRPVEYSTLWILLFWSRLQLRA
jgi:hypothetical protein